MISDKNLIRENDKSLASAAPAVSGQLAYTGSAFAHSVQGYLRQHVSQKQSFKN